MEISGTMKGVVRTDYIAGVAAQSAKSRGRGPNKTGRKEGS